MLRFTGLHFFDFVGEKVRFWVRCKVEKIKKKKKLFR